MLCLSMFSFQVVRRHKGRLRYFNPRQAYPKLYVPSMEHIFVLKNHKMTRPVIGLVARKSIVTMFNCVAMQKEL
jgi:hypothetical protein